MNRKKERQFDDQEIIDALTRIISSQEFEKTYRLRQLLEHLVKKQLDGQGNELKGYNIGLDVFRKGKDFDPDSDTIVRVQMVRLRRMLEHYYLTTGKNDPISIEIPKGRYVPAFFENKNTNEEEPGTRELNGNHRLFGNLNGLVNSAPYLLAIIVGLICLMSYWLTDSPSLPIAFPEKVEKKQTHAKQPSCISLAVFPFNDAMGKIKNSPLIKGLPTQLIHDLSRFKNLFVFAPDVTLRNELIDKGSIVMARKMGARFALMGTFVQTDKKVSVSAYLLASETGQVVWSRKYTRSLVGRTLEEVQSAISGLVASHLGQPYGIINRMETVFDKQHGEKTNDGHECVLQFFDYAKYETAKKHKNVRDCLEKASIEFPNNAQVWAALSWMYVDEDRRGFNPKHNAESPPFERALAAVRKAVNIDPDDAFVYRRLADVLLAIGDSFSAREAILHAMELNPNDAEIIADTGWILKNVGEWDKAMEYATKAMQLNPGFPPWYLETPVLYYYKNKDCKNVLNFTRNYQLASVASVLHEVLPIIAAKQCAASGWEKQVAVLNAKYPSFLKYPEVTLRKLSIPEELIVGIVRQLRQAGVRFAG
jgi:TolB-like protein